MKVTISVGGKFHAFHLAGQLEKRGYLSGIFTSYPWFALKDSNLPRDKVNCLAIKEILERVLPKIPFLSKKADTRYFTANFFDNQVAKRVKPCDIFVGASGYSLKTIEKIRRSFAAKVIIERVSSYTETYWDILRQEGDRLGIKLNFPSSRVIDKELQEYRQADYVAVPSLFAKQTFLANNFPESKLICMPWGVDVDVFRPILKGDNVFRIIGVGMRIIKGIHYLLQAVGELKLKNLELWLIGGGLEPSLEPFLKKYSGSFKYIGAIPQRDLYKYYSQGSLFVNFALEDGFSMAALEAIACGCAVICSDATGAKDVIRDGIDGFIVPSRDVEALKKKILYFYENMDICRQMGRQARENITNNFTWDDYGEKIINVYHNLLK